MSASEDLEGLRDALGRECKKLFSISEDKWQFGGLGVKGLEAFDVNVKSISQSSKPKQTISELIQALDLLQFAECQRRKKWNEIYKNEKSEAIRTEIMKKMWDSEERSFTQVNEIVRLLKGVQSASTQEGLESSSLDSHLEEVLVS